MDPLSTISTAIGGVVLATAAAHVPGWWTRKRARTDARRDPDGITDDLVGLRALGDDSAGAGEAEAEAEADLDICFVHGLTGRAKSTWTTMNPETGREVFWPRDLLAAEWREDNRFPSTRILVYGYDTEVHSLSWLTARTLFHHASVLVEELSGARSGKSVQRPLLFVAHGLGGILVKNALAFARYAGSSEPSEIFARTIGIISFGVPQTGESDAALWETLLRSQRLTNNKFSKPNYKGMGTDEGRREVSLLQRRLGKYKPLATAIPEVYVFEESIPNDDSLLGYDLWLPKADPRNINPDSYAIAVAQDFLSLTKFSHRDDNYKCICTKIKEYHRKFPKRRNSGLLQDKENNLINRGSAIRNLGFDVGPINLPSKPAKVIFGKSRKHYLERLKERLKTDRYVPLNGEPEIGKTMIALNYAYEQLELPADDKSKPSCILWLDGESELSLQACFGTIARRLGEIYPPNVWPRSNEDREAAARSVLDWLASPGNKGWLLIYDNVPSQDVPYLQPYIPKDFLGSSSPTRGRIIVALRPQHNGLADSHKENSDSSAPRQTQDTEGKFRYQWDRKEQFDAHGNIVDPGGFLHPRYKSMGPGSQNPSRRNTVFEWTRQCSDPLQIGEFTRQESVDLLINDLKLSNSEIRDRSKETQDDMDVDLDKVWDTIAERASDSPGQIKRASAQLRSAKDFRATRNELCGSGNYEDIPEDHKQWLDPCMMLSYDPIPIEVAETLQMTTSPVWGHQGNVIEVLEKLQASGWVEVLPDRKSFRIPSKKRRDDRRLVLIGGEDWSDVKDCVHKACNAIIETLRQYRNHPILPELEQLLLKHMGECLSHLRKWVEDVRCDWEILANLCEKHDRPRDALEFLKAIVSQGFPGPNMPRTRSRVRSRESWSSFDVVFEGRAQAEQFNEALRSASLDRQHPDTQDEATEDSRNLRCVLSIIRLKVRLGQYEDKGEGCEKKLKKIEDRTEKRYVDLRIGLLQQLVNIKQARKEWKQAIDRSYELLILLEGRHGCTAAETISSLRQLAQLHRDQGDYAKAVDLLERALISYEDGQGGPSYPLSHEVLQELANAHQEWGNMKKARKVCIHLRESLTSRHGGDHTKVARVWEQLGHIYELIGQPEEADSSFREAILQSGDGDDLWNNEQQRLDEVHKRVKAARQAANAFASRYTM